jgi:hypothetical protein
MWFLLFPVLMILSEVVISKINRALHFNSLHMM